MSVQVGPVASGEIDAVRQLRLDNGRAHRVGSPSQLAELIARSQLALVAVEDDGLVGLVRFTVAMGHPRRTS
ncbi:MAG: hypothetical protein ING40_04505 [Burkholderiales bacterium]|nr:hypothetical protein [Burkholderiales bacterium]MCA3228280.1 hypothetical protein [Burkholderiales bacterium]